MSLGLNDLMKNLYISNEYFVSIDRGDIDYSNYWGVVKDPDGVTRNLIEEESSYVKNLNYIIKYINKLEPGKILDIGCGFGFLLKNLNNKWDKYGIEPNDNTAEKYCNFTNQPFKKDLYPENYFDVINIHHVIEHVKDPLLCINEIKRILKPSGYLIIATPDFDSGGARLFGDNYRLLHDKTHISLFSNDSIHRMLRDYNFHIQNVEYPFFDTTYFNKDNLTKLFNTDKISPPFYGNFMTFFCKNEK